jgi:predicted DNA-binding protein
MKQLTPNATKGRSLSIEMSPEFERRLEEVAAQNGQGAAEYARQVLEERLRLERAERDLTAQKERNQRAIALLRQWSEEDAVNPDPDPMPIIPPLSLREVTID